MDPVPDWHICVQGSRYRTVNASCKYPAIGAFRSFSRHAPFVTVRAAPRRAEKHGEMNPGASDAIEVLELDNGGLLGE
jgi:hypothetical protein